MKNLDLNYFSKIATENPDEAVYTAVVKATALERNIRVVIVQKHKNGKVDDVKIYFSTDTEVAAEEVLEIYRTRFQIEFLYRDAKVALSAIDTDCTELPIKSGQSHIIIHCRFVDFNHFEWAVENARGDKL